MTTAIGKPKFSLGQILATPGALDALEESGQDVQFFLSRHVQGDWGEVDDEDKVLNDQSLVDGSRLLSAYRTLKNQRLWIITEAADDHGHRASSTILEARTSIDRPSNLHRLADTDWDGMEYLEREKHNSLRWTTTTSMYSPVRKPVFTGAFLFRQRIEIAEHPSQHLPINSPIFECSSIPI